MATDWWKPAAGTTFSYLIALDGAKACAPNTDVHVVDLDNADGSSGTRVAYISVGTIESWRKDYSRIPADAKGAAMPDWPGETWINPFHPVVRQVMCDRFDDAVRKGFRGVDLDNVDFQSNGQDFGGSEVDAWLYWAQEAHARGLAIGLKNAAEILPQVSAQADFAVNEQMSEYGDEAAYVDFAKTKPVLCVEYKRAAYDKPHPQGVQKVLMNLALTQIIASDIPAPQPAPQPAPVPRPAPGGSMLVGIDISGYQPADQDMTGYDFVFIKATEGLHTVNDKYKAQLAKARALNKFEGFYHFSWVMQDPIAEVDHFLGTIGTDLLPGDPLWLDWEVSAAQQLPANGGPVDPDKDRAYKDAFLAELKRRMPDHVCGLYTYRDRWKNVDKSGLYGDDLWIADYNGTPGTVDITAPWVFHQWTDKGPNGEDLDRNVSKFATADDYLTWAHRFEKTNTKGGITSMGTYVMTTNADGTISLTLTPDTVAPQPAPQPVPQPAPQPVPADDGQDRHLPDGVWSDTLTLQRLQKAATTDVLTDDGDYRHRIQAIYSIRKLLNWTDDCVPPQGRPWHEHFVMFYKAWQEHLGWTGADADGVPGESSVWSLCQADNLKYWNTATGLNHPKA